MYRPSIDRDLLVRVIVSYKDKPGEIISYEELSEAIGRDIVSCRHLLESARRFVQREHQMVLESVRGVGLRVMSDSEKALSSSATLRKTGRAMRRGGEVTACADFQKLKPEVRDQALAGQSLMGAIAALSAPSARKRITQRVSQSATEVAIATAETLRMFMKKD